MKKLERVFCSIFLLGEDTVGKPEIISKYTNQSLNLSNLNTMGFDYVKKDITLKCKPLTLKIWDARNQGMVRGGLRPNVQSSDIILFIYNINDIETFKILTKEWLRNLDWVNQQKYIPQFLVGNNPNNENKREISFIDAYRTAKKMCLPFCEINSQTGENIDKLFKCVLLEFLKNDNNKGINGHLTIEKEG